MEVGPYTHAQALSQARPWAAPQAWPWAMPGLAWPGDRLGQSVAIFNFVIPTGITKSQNQKTLETQ